MHRAGSTFRLAGGPRSPSSSAAPTPGAVRLARGDQRTSGASSQEPGTSAVHLPTHRSQHVSRGRCTFSDSGAVSGPQASAGYPMASGIPDPIASRRPFRARRLSSACKPRDRASGRRGVFFRVQLGALGGAPLFPNVPSRDPRGEAFDGYQESAAQGDLCLDTAPQTTGEGRASARSAWRGAPFPRGHSWRRLRRARTFSATDQHGGLGLARRLPLVLSARGEGRRGTSTVTQSNE